MKSFLKHREEALENLSNILLRFFFNARGSHRSRSLEAMYRILISNLIEVSPLVLCDVLARYLRKGTCGTIFQWHTAELADVFHDTTGNLD